MLSLSQRLLAGLLGLMVLCSGARVQADPILEPNNSAATATILNSGQFSITDGLNANVGRPDTLLGLWDPEYTTLLDSDDNDSSLGNGFASQLTFVPLNANGSAYFMITGAADTDFIARIRRRDSTTSASICTIRTTTSSRRCRSNTRA